MFIDNFDMFEHEFNMFKMFMICQYYHDFNIFNSPNLGTLTTHLKLLFHVQNNPQPDKTWRRAMSFA